MPRLFNLKLPANVIDYIMRGRPGGLIDENRAIKSIKFMHAQ